MLPLGGETVVRLRGAVGTDGYGDGSHAVDWSQPPTRLAIDGCSVQPMPVDEVLDGRQAVVSRWTLYAPYDADLTAVDRVEHQGQTYDVDGSVQPFRDPTGTGLDHTVCLLRRSDG